MIFNEHFRLRDSHAFMAPSNPAWVNYDLDKLETTYINKQAAAKGDRLHKLAADMIRERVRAQATKATLNMYVNDAIGYKMVPEQILYYSDVCYGSADAIVYRRGKLRVHDLKTGTIVPGKMLQLRVYAALFCLEYGFNPMDIEIELRIYQFDEVKVEVSEPEGIVSLMKKIKDYSDYLENRMMEGAI